MNIVSACCRVCVMRERVYGPLEPLRLPGWATRERQGGVCRSEYQGNK